MILVAVFSTIFFSSNSPAPLRKVFQPMSEIFFSFRLIEVVIIKEKMSL